LFVFVFFAFGVDDMQGYIQYNMQRCFPEMKLILSLETSTLIEA